MTDGPIVLFDGVCNFCTASVQFILKRDKRVRYRFASLQSDAARRLLEPCLRSGPVPDAIVLVENGECVFASTAALRIGRSFGGVWRLLGMFWIVPRPVRDAVYRWFARRRYGWFGKRDTCYVPTPEERSRFLE